MPPPVGVGYSDEDSLSETGVNTPKKYKISFLLSSTIVELLPLSGLILLTPRMYFHGKISQAVVFVCKNPDSNLLLHVMIGDAVK
jgi:hypothetical protein